MHVVMFGDQHLESLGGAQVSMRLQRRFLEKAGHTVTIKNMTSGDQQTVARATVVAHLASLTRGGISG